MCVSRGFLGTGKATEETPELWDIKGAFPREEHCSSVSTPEAVACVFI